MDSQEVISKEIAEAHATAAERTPKTQPELDFSAYRSSVLRHPTKALRQVDPEGVELVAPVFGHSDVNILESDLTTQGGAQVNGGQVMGASRSGSG